MRLILQHHVDQISMPMAASATESHWLLWPQDIPQHFRSILHHLIQDSLLRRSMRASLFHVSCRTIAANRPPMYLCGVNKHKNIAIAFHTVPCWAQATHGCQGCP